MEEAWRPTTPSCKFREYRDRQQGQHVNFVLQDNGRLEIHIPESFTDTRPAVRYYHEDFDSNIGDHPVASQLPRAGPIAKTTDNIWNSFGSLTIPPGGPQKLVDYVSRDEPQLSLRVNSFRDATLVSLNCLHNLTDGQGIGIILKAWSDVMAEKEAQVPDKIGAFEDALARFGSAVPKEQLQFADKLAGLESKPSVAGNAWDALVNAKSQSKSIFLHKRVINKIKEKAVADLSARGFPPEVALNGDPSKPFLSEGDVLVSWLSRHALAQLAPSTPQPVTIINSYDIRHRVPSAFAALDSGGTNPIYVGNATLRGHIYVPSSLVMEAPLGEFGMAVRMQLVKQTTPEQIHARVAVDCKILNSAEGARASFIQAGSTRIFFTNWSKAHLYEKADFSAAVVQPDAGDGGPKPGLVSYIHTQVIGVGNLPLNVFQIPGKDREGNYWIEGCMTVQAWESLEKDLEVLNKFDSL